MKDLLFKRNFNFISIIISFTAGMAMFSVIITQKITVWSIISFIFLIFHLSYEIVISDKEEINYCPNCGMNLKAYKEDEKGGLYNE